ncbi:hypothetical protein HMPREF9371_0278 [Neisseria shayeganii 871]|uniref:Uncharacterized protein n=1 Tax=Neisseria shayeganii 871 TaxID=1032488 RepID=G4CF89_9NEIS|nr:hypothetical protein HMPREF9371_0278 [Neisseria shayeganii 871]
MPFKPITPTIPLQVAISVRKGELAQTLSAQADDERRKAANWQRSGVLLDMISAGLSAPTQSTAGIAVATASPMISYEIGQ